MNKYEYFGVTFYLVEGGEAERMLLDELAEYEWYSETRPRLIEWLATEEAAQDINYSDIFKDVWGVRPY